MKYIDTNINDLLKFAMDNDMIDISYMQEQVQMKKREEILKQHPYKIWEDKNGYWNTYLPNGNERKRIKKRDKNDLINIIIKFWKSKQSDSNSFRKRYDIWIDRQRKCGRSDNTIYKYQCDFKRFFEGDKICKEDILQIDDEYIYLFIQRLLERKPIPYRALKAMFGYMNGVFEKAIIDKVICNNPCKYVDLPTFKHLCLEEREKSASERTLSVSEKNALLKKLDSDGKPDYIVKYAVELAMYTGMRVGELAALRWEDIDFSQEEITIRHSEKHNRLTNEYTISTTKNSKIRKIPLTNEMKTVLFRVKEAEIKNGFISEWVFSDENGRVHSRVISNCARNRTASKEFTNPKSIHAIRRTVNSDMRCSGVSPVVAASLLGHTVKVNNENYTYDVSDMNYKHSVISQINKRMKCI